MKNHSWKAEHLDAVATRGTGHTPSRKNGAYWNGDIRWLSLADTERLDRRFVHETSFRISQAGLDNSSAVLHPPGTVVLLRGSSVGKSAILGSDISVSQDYVTWTCGPRLLNTFLYEWLQWMKPEFERISNGSTVKTIGMPYFEKLSIPIPKLPEQKKITSILAAWDEASHLLERLLAANESRFFTLSQRLLSGSIRLPEFRRERPWSERRFGDLFSERVETDRDDLPLLSITATAGVVSRNSLTKKDTSAADKSGYLRICPGDIGYNTMRMWQGVSGLSSLEGLISPAYTVLIPGPEIDGRFASYLLKSKPVVHLLWRHSQGLVDDTLNLKYQHFAQIHAKIPTNVREQRRIADIIGRAETEIYLLRQQHAALSIQKRGLMQLLLTGKKRVRA